MNSKEEQTNSDATNLENESSKKNQKDTNYINENIEDNQLDEKSKDIEEDNQLDENSKDIEEEYQFGWSSYSEITNGRFAMIGFLAIILIEFISQQSFLKWAGIL